MGNTARTTDLDPTIATRVQEYVTEALTGPLKGGLAGELRVGSVVLDAAASRDWGVQFSRSLPGGTIAQERLAGPEISVSHAGAAISRLLQAA